MPLHRPTPPTGTPKPIEYRQLCALVREQLLTDPTISDGEWADRIKDRLVQYGFDYPRPEALAAAMSAVEYALKRTLGPRPVRMAPTPGASRTVPPALPSKPTPAEWARMSRIVRGLAAPTRARANHDCWTRVSDVPSARGLA